MVPYSLYKYSIWYLKWTSTYVGINIEVPVVQEFPEELVTWAFLKSSAIWNDYEMCSFPKKPGKFLSAGWDTATSKAS